MRAGWFAGGASDRLTGAMEVRWAATRTRSRSPAPPERVYDLYTDLDRVAEWQEGRSRRYTQDTRSAISLRSGLPPTLAT